MEANFLSNRASNYSVQSFPKVNIYSNLNFSQTFIKRMLPFQILQDAVGSLNKPTVPYLQALKRLSLHFLFFRIFQSILSINSFLDVKYLWVMEQSFMINKNPGSSNQCKTLKIFLQIQSGVLQAKVIATFLKIQSFLVFEQQSLTLESVNVTVTESLPSDRFLIIIIIISHKTKV